MNEPELLEALKRSVVALRQVKQRVRELEDASREPIAIVGMGCRFAGGATSPDALWDLLARGVDAASEVPRDRWDVDEFYDPDPEAAGKMITRSAGFLDDVFGFDSAFFGIAPREARRMDPQQRLLLEVAWEALEHAGIPPETLLATQTGVFVGINAQEYATPHLDELADLDGYVLTGTHPSVASGRISYVLGTNGPSITLDTACSSSLVAVHLACQSLRSGECDAALAGGVGLLLAPTLHVEFSRLRGLAANGRCKSFDDAADGMGWGEGCGVVVLKRLTDALAAGDRVLAVIRGSAVNQDGRSNGLTAPNGPSQEEVIARALERAGASPADVGYVEAHGAGTPLGDPIEAQALGAVLAVGRSSDSPVFLGSIKSNIGHTMAAAGVAGLIKTVLTLQHQIVPPSLHFAKPSRHIPWDTLPLQVPTVPTPWPSNGKPRIAGVSSFGVSGTNAHLVVEEAPASSPAAPNERDRGGHLLVVSAKTEAALRLQAARYAEHLGAHPEIAFADTCHAAAQTRTHWDERLAVVAATADEARARLLATARGETAPGCVVGRVAGSARRPRIAFLFTGQGSQYVGMGRDLYDTEPVFREALDACARILERLLPLPLLSVIYPEAGEATPLDETRYTQPALFAIEYALAQLWLSWGVAPDAVMGHSVGEYVAACVAGVFSLDDGLKLIAARGRLMQDLPPGGEMASVKTDAARVRKLLEAAGEAEVSIAGFNGPEAVVLSGRREPLRALCKQLEAQGIKTKTLNVSIASHSPLMDPMLDEFERIAGEVTFHPPRMTVVSNVSGSVAGSEIGTAAYWRSHVREAVRFEQGMRAIRALGVDMFIEAGPQSVLLGMGASCLAGDTCTWLPSLKKDASSWGILLESLGRVHVSGTPIDWKAYDAPFARSRVCLPTYAFEPQRYRVDRPRAAGGAPSATAATGRAGAHPLSGVAVAVPGETVHRVVLLGASHQPYLSDHLVHGQMAVPGSLFIAVLLAVAVDGFNAHDVTLRDVQFVRPLVVAKETALHIAMTPAPDGVFNVTMCTAHDSADGTQTIWRDHVQAVLSFRAEPDVAARSIAALRATCPEPRSVAGLFAQFEAMHVVMGPQWRCLDEAFGGDGAGLVRATPLAGVRHADAPLHPALVDNCFAAAILALGSTPSSGRDGRDRRDAPHLLWGIKELRWRGATTTAVWSHARSRAPSGETRTADLVVLDDADRVVLEAEGLTFKRAERAAFASLAGAERAPSMFTVEWVVSEPASSRALSGRWLVVASDASGGAQLAQRLNAAGANAAVAAMRDVAGIVRSATNGERFAGVVCWWGTEPSARSGDRDRIAQARAYALEAHEAIRALAGSLSNPTNPPRLYWLTEGAQAALPNELVALEAAALWGLGRAAAQEHPELHVTLVDLEPHARAVDTVLGALQAGDDETEIAFRSGKRHVARLVPARAPGQAGPARERGTIGDGTVLVTGGLGGLGLRVAEWLVEARGVRSLLLVGRSAPAAARLERVEALRARGAEVRVTRGDVSVASDVARILAEVPDTAPLRGIVHAAGVASSTPLAQLDEAGFASVFLPKAAGAWNLHLQTLACDLDFFLLFSSIQSVVGSATQGSYAAANAFLDALAHHRRSKGLVGMSVNWGAWSGEGMASRLDEGERLRLARAGFGTIAPDEALSLLDETLDRPEAQIMLARVDVAAMQKALAGDVAAPIFRALVATAPLATPRRGGAGDRGAALKQRLRALPAVERERVVTDLVRAEVAAVLRLSGPGALPIDQALKPLGLDSLMALEIPNRLKALTGEAFAATLLYDHPTVRAVSAFVLRKLGVPTDAPQITHDEIAQALRSASLEDLRALNLLDSLRGLAEKVRGREPKPAPPEVSLDGATDEQLFSLIDADVARLG